MNSRSISHQLQKLLSENQRIQLQMERSLASLKNSVEQKNRSIHVDDIDFEDKMHYLKSLIAAIESDQEKRIYQYPAEVITQIVISLQRLALRVP